MSKCENCIYYERCDHYHIATDTGKYAYQNIDLEIRDDVEDICDDFKAKSLFVELPCKVGDTAYIIDDTAEYQEPYVLDVKVSQIGFDKNGLWATLDLPLGMKQSGYTKIGKTVFLTKEDAEQKLKELENGK